MRLSLVTVLRGLLLAVALVLTLPASAFWSVTPTQGLAEKGDHSVCRYTWGLSRAGYQSARVSYPCGLRHRAPAITLTGGFTNIKEQMYWLSDHLSSHGFIVITMTPRNIFGTPPVWEDAHKAGYAELLEQNRTWWSPLRRRIDQGRIGMVGYSMGGGGALLASADLGERITAVAGLSPFLGQHQPDYEQISAASLLLGGSLDFVATPASVQTYYQQLPPQTRRVLGIIRGLNHVDWVNLIGPGGTMKNRARILVTAWLKLQLEGDASVADIFDGRRHNQHLADDWYTLYQSQ